MEKFLLVFKKIFSQKVLFWIVTFVTIFILMYPKFPLLNITGTFVAIRIEDLLIMITTLVWIGYLFVSYQLKPLFKNTLTQLVMVFFLVGLVSTFSAIFLTQTVTPHLAILHFLRRIELILLLFIAYSAISNRKQLYIFVCSLLGTTLIINLYALGQKYLNWPVISTTNSEFSKGLILYLTPGARVNSTFAGHYDLAVFLSMMLVILTAIFFYVKKLVYKVIIASIILLSFYVLVLTAARMSFVAAIVGIFLTLVILRKKFFIMILILVTIGAIIYPSTLRDRFISTIKINLLQVETKKYSAVNEEQKQQSQLNIPTLRVDTSLKSREETTTAAKLQKVASDIAPGEPTNSTELEVYRSLGIRFDIEWPRAIRAFLKNPFVGTGYSSIGLATDNDFLRSLGEVGLLGTVSFALILIYIIKKLWFEYKHSVGFIKLYLVGTLLMIITFLMSATFIDVFEASKVASLFWILIGTVLAIKKFRGNNE